MSHVLRQYEESEVAPAWQLMVSRLQPGGVLIEGTCNEVDRVASWVDVTAHRPRHPHDLPHLPSLESPSVVAERLPKALIYRNVPGERIHDYLPDLDRWWAAHPARRLRTLPGWVAVATSMRDAGWPILGAKSRWRLGELTVASEAVAPAG